MPASSRQLTDELKLMQFLLPCRLAVWSCLLIPTTMLLQSICINKVTVLIITCKRHVTVEQANIQVQGEQEQHLGNVLRILEMFTPVWVNTQETIDESLRCSTISCQCHCRAFEALLLVILLISLWLKYYRRKWQRMK